MPVYNGHFFYVNIYNTETKHKYDPKGILKFNNFLFLIKIVIPIKEASILEIKNM